MTERRHMMRLDVAVVRGKLARSRDQAKDVIVSGRVQVDGRTVTKPARRVQDSAEISRTDGVEQWVGRAAHKLLAALDRWTPVGLVVTQCRCIDIGASTGGFTQVLLSHGAASVLSIDVGTRQLVASLAADPRVTDVSGTHVLSLSGEDVGPADLIVMDVSFISAATVLEHVAPWCQMGGSLVVLVKPQFEVGRQAVGSGGVVHSASSRVAAVQHVMATAYRGGLALRGVMRSPITGRGGNIEYLLWLSPAVPGMMDQPAAFALAENLEQEGRR
ncbi:MAG: TlyA family RNA methyltransferase [Ornithinimicrobium sp.]